MIELRNDSLVFSFPEVHPDAELTIRFQRTLRIPDDEKHYPLPPGLGCFPLRHVDDFSRQLPVSWREHGGGSMPMHQSEAMWINFSSKFGDNRNEYGFVVKIATGKVNAITGEDWTDGIHRDPQDYMVVPSQPWLDGYCIEKGTIRQFVAMPLGSGYTAEEQIRGSADIGGLQIVVYPMKREVFERRFPKIVDFLPIEGRDEATFEAADASAADACAPDLGLAPGGRMTQDIYDDPFDFEDWDMRHRSRCFVHLANSETWGQITGEMPPNAPPSARTYSSHGIPWFDYYSEQGSTDGGGKLGEILEPVSKIAKKLDQDPLSANESLTTSRIHDVGPKVRPIRFVREC